MLLLFPHEEKKAIRQQIMRIFKILFKMGPHFIGNFVLFLYRWQPALPKVTIHLFSCNIVAEAAVYLIQMYLSMIRPVKPEPVAKFGHIVDQMIGSRF
jgi:hypothetical protein